MKLRPQSFYCVGDKRLAISIELVPVELALPLQNETGGKISHKQATKRIADRDNLSLHQQVLGISKNKRAERERIGVGAPKLLQRQ
jgi:hypothetical protein